MFKSWAQDIAKTTILWSFIKSKYVIKGYGNSHNHKNSLNKLRILAQNEQKNLFIEKTPTDNRENVSSNATVGIK